MSGSPHDSQQTGQPAATELVLVDLGTCAHLEASPQALTSATSTQLELVDKDAFVPCSEG